jgi:hypothetical protein
MSNIPHTAYMASLAPPLAALSGAGIVMFWRWYRAGSRAGWLLPVAVAAELAWAYYLWSGFRAFLPWVLPVAIGLGVVAVVIMVAGRLSRRARGRGGGRAGDRGGSHARGADGLGGVGTRQPVRG